MNEGLQKEGEIESLYIMAQQKSGHKNLSVEP